MRTTIWKSGLLLATVVLLNGCATLFPTKPDGTYTAAPIERDHYRIELVRVSIASFPANPEPTRVVVKVTGKTEEEVTVFWGISRIQDHPNQPPVETSTRMWWDDITGPVNRVVRQGQETKAELAILSDTTRSGQGRTIRQFRSRDFRVFIETSGGGQINTDSLFVQFTPFMGATRP